ncbi:hypothetical protein BY457_11044 [Marinilabilia salmonicolor]|jgi:hypothetical protein|uniref:hypothetical protein n=1 Tax=Marinilabilia salmonicolor TaxID=989 RepID=UPI000D0532BC|nr:hypothetical protein [Marinilabilia salmonicolor]PRY98232.1 hypothetical protein BY457_11044 [Marinilabilia salmonicolor]
MIKALLYKEWIKTRWFLLAIAIAGLLLHIYMFMRVGRSIRLVGAEHIWDVIITRNQFLFSELKYLPLLSGALLGLSQFIPEITNRRIKLTFHLPLREKTITTWMVGFGFILLTGLFLVQFAGLFTGIHLLFAPEIVSNGALTVLPWYVAGLWAYLACVFVAVEPTWRMRIPNLLISTGLIRILFLSDFPAAYAPMPVLMLAGTILFVLFLWLSVFRLKVGRQ